MVSPLHMAISTNKADLVRSLIAKKADVNLENSEKKTPLDKSNTASKEVKNLLLQAGARYSAGTDQWGGGSSSRNWWGKSG